MDILHRRGRATVAEVMASSPASPPTPPSARSCGCSRRKATSARGRATPLRVPAGAVPPGGQSIGAQARARHLFQGSPEQVVEALLGKDGSGVSREELDRIADVVERATRESRRRVIKATIVLLAAHVMIPLLSRRSAAERHAVWTAVLATAALLPLLTWLLPSWEPGWAQRAADSWPAAFENRSAGGQRRRHRRSCDRHRTGRMADRSACCPVLWSLGKSCAVAPRSSRQAMRLNRLTSRGVRRTHVTPRSPDQVAESLSLPTPSSDVQRSHPHSAGLGRSGAHTCSFLAPRTTGLTNACGRSVRMRWRTSPGATGSRICSPRSRAGSTGSIPCSGWPGLDWAAKASAPLTTSSSDWAQAGLNTRRT